MSTEPKAPLGLTPSQTIGPFFAYALTPRAYGGKELATGQVAGEGVAGERIRIEGVVYDGDGVPVGDAMLETWQADAEGRFNAAGNAGFIGFGRAETTASSDIARTPFTTISARMTSTSAIIGFPHVTGERPGAPAFDFASWPSSRDPYAFACGKVAEELPGHPARTRPARGLPFDRLGLQPVFRHVHPMRRAIAADHRQIIILRTGMEAQP